MAANQPARGRRTPLDQRPDCGGAYFQGEEDGTVAAFRQQLYDREVQVQYTTGVALLYRLDTWHRGTPLIAGATRRVQSMIMKRVDAEWIQPTFRCGSPVLHMYHPTQTLEKLIVNTTVLQRALMGFPSPDSKYWTIETAAAVAAHFPGLDATPYHEGLSTRVLSEQQAAA